MLGLMDSASAPPDLEREATMVGIALRLSAASPDSLYPCPRCFAALRGSNVVAHLAKVHSIRASTPSEHGGTLRVRGDARFLIKPVAIAFGGWALMAFLFAFFRPRPDDLDMTIVGVAFLATFGPLLALLLGVIPARLELDAESIRLFGPLGREARVIRFPCELSTGLMRERRPNPGSTAEHDAGAHDVDAGTYLRLSTGRTTLTIGGRGTPRHDGRWSDSAVHKGEKTKRWDITIDTASFVAIEYHLASRGWLFARDS